MHLLIQSRINFPRILGILCRLQEKIQMLHSKLFWKFSKLFTVNREFDDKISLILFNYIQLEMVLKTSYEEDYHFITAFIICILLKRNFNDFILIKLTEIQSRHLFKYKFHIQFVCFCPLSADHKHN